MFPVVAGGDCTSLFDPLLGQRDDDWRRDLTVASLAGLGVFERDLRPVAADPAGAGRAAAAHVAAALPDDRPAWWLHVDLDVLDPALFPAQGVPGVPDEPGGLTPEQLQDLVTAALGVPGCAGLSLAIDDPEQDPDDSGAATVIDLVRTASAALLG
ncbi:arginase family protein [Nakamurella leprariae]|uniref:Arginase family protein n=1 Tax=Nakamurella leprariae TaxID=2803911 RepID=A0A939C1D2_9ACTN|nr:arginase family protein [Nakamurella leprariae]MBM9467037.1 arginase family protein [Nakamurella leprariae]